MRHEDTTITPWPCHHVSVTSAPLEPLLTQQQVADAFQVSVRTVREWTKTGIFNPVVRIAGTIRYHRSVVERVQAGSEQESTHDDPEPCHCARN